MPRYTGKKLNDYMREYRKKNGYKHEKKRRRKLFLFVQDYKSVRGCAACGARDPIVLELDHNDPALKIAAVSTLIGGNGCSMKTLVNELEKCTVLCANCHRRKTAKQFGHYL